MTDGYDGYGAAVSRYGVDHAGCWAHARRKFDEAIKAQGTKSKGKGKGGKAMQALAHIRHLYAVERQANDGQLTPDQRHALRQEQSRPRVEKLRAWLDESLPQVPPKSALGKALGFLNNQRSKLVRFLDDGRIPLDDNPAENATRPFVVGRKAWLFCDTVAGAQASANLYSLVETAKASGIEPYRYLRHIFTHLPAAETVADVEAVLPSALNADEFNAAPLCVGPWGLLRAYA